MQVVVESASSADRYLPTLLTNYCGTYMIGTQEAHARNACKGRLRESTVAVMSQASHGSACCCSYNLCYLCVLYTVSQFCGTCVRNGQTHTTSSQAVVTAVGA